MKQVVALDFDDLIYPFMAGLVPFVNNTQGTHYTLEDFHTFEFEEIWGGTRDEAIDRVEKFFEQIDEHPEPLAGAAVAIEKLTDRYELAVVTARPETFRKRTEDWLDAHLAGLIKSVHLCGTYATSPDIPSRAKVDVCKEIDAVALVDDSLHNVSDLAAIGRSGIVFGDYPWNRSDELPDGVVRALDWDDVLRELLGDN